MSRAKQSPSRFWSVAEESKILAEYNITKTCAQLAKEFNVTPDILKAKAGRMRYSGKDVKTNKAEPGEVRLKSGKQRMKQADGSWQYIKSGRKNAPKYKDGDLVTRRNGQEYRKEGTKWVYVRKCPELSRTPSNVHTPAKSEKVAVSVCNERKRALFTDRNPAQVKVKKEEGGFWVRIDPRTLVYRKQQNAA